MRVDKFLKVARILKKRPIAKQLAINDRLLINNRVAKASSEIKVNDEVTIVFGHRELSFRVLALKEQVSKQEALSMYEIIKDNTIETEV